MKYLGIVLFSLLMLGIVILRDEGRIFWQVYVKGDENFDAAAYRKRHRIVNLIIWIVATIILAVRLLVTG